MENTPRTLAQIQETIRAARDSVWVINNQIEKLIAGETPNENNRGNIERNVDHLKLIVASAEVIGSGEDIADLHEAIAFGEAKLAENIWTSNEEPV